MSGVSTSKRAFSDVQMAVTEVLALIGCMQHTIAKGSDIEEPDLLAACDGVKRMLVKISNELCDLETAIA